MSTELTKKQQKAQAFRAKQKAKKGGRGEVDIQDVPEADLDVDGDDVVSEKTVKREEKAEGRKRKREDGQSGDASGAGPSTAAGAVDAKAEDGADSKAKAKSKGKGKKSAWDDDEADGEGGEAGKAGKKTKKDVKQRFILFIGKLSLPCIWLRS